MQLGVTMAECRRQSCSSAADAAADEYCEVLLKRRRSRARMYSTVKYALGHDKAFTRVVVSGTSMFDHGQVPAPVPPTLRSSEGGSAAVAVRTS
jgi:hypothetical protein